MANLIDMKICCAPTFRSDVDAPIYPQVKTPSTITDEECPGSLCGRGRTNSN